MRGSPAGRRGLPVRCRRCAGSRFVSSTSGICATVTARFTPASFLRERRSPSIARPGSFPASSCTNCSISSGSGRAIRAGGRTSDLLDEEFRRGARGELGWSAEWRKLELDAGRHLRPRTRRWREYCCESFCDTAAWLYSGIGRAIRSLRLRRLPQRRRAWFANELENRTFVDIIEVRKYLCPFPRLSPAIAALAARTDSVGLLLDRRAGQGRLGQAENDRKPAPDFALKDADGKIVNLSDYKGKVVLLDFWATWCGPCKIEIPWFMDLQRKSKDRGFEVLGVAMDDEGWEVVKPFLTEVGVNYRVVIGNDSTAQAYGGVDALPTTFLIDRDGKIAAVHVGLASKKDFEDGIEQLLKLPPEGGGSRCCACPSGAK